MAQAVPYLLAAATAVSTYGVIQQGQTQQKIANRNADAANYSAQDALERGATAEQVHRQKVQQLISSQTAAAGASGAAVESQSFQKVIDQSTTMGELDIQTIRTNALREAWAFKNQATGFNLQGQMDREASLYTGVGTALTGFAGAAKAGQLTQPSKSKVG